MESHKLAPAMIAETQDTALMKTLASEGRGLIVVSEQAVRQLLESGHLVKLAELEHRFEEIWLVSAQRKIQNPVAEHLMKEFDFF